MHDIARRNTRRLRRKAHFPCPRAQTCRADIHGQSVLSAVRSSGDEIQKHHALGRFHDGYELAILARRCGFWLALRRPRPLRSRLAARDFDFYRPVEAEVDFTSSSRRHLPPFRTLGPIFLGLDVMPFPKDHRWAEGIPCMIVEQLSSAPAPSERTCQKARGTRPKGWRKRREAAQ
ncbi:MAG: hypothetical protein GY717_03390 [Rhodobacteraceae bacterium]|nr:hypothetical protein [Paracoccaceae bacterium]